MPGLAAITRDILSAHESEATRRGLAIEPSITATPVLIDAHLLLRFVTKLLENALRYNLPQGRIGNELDPVPDAELHEYPPDVSLDGRLAEVQLLANPRRSTGHARPAP